MINTSFVNLCLAGVTRNVPIIDQLYVLRALMTNSVYILFTYLNKQFVIMIITYLVLFTFF